MSEKHQRYKNLPIGTIMITNGLKNHQYTWRKITKSSWVCVGVIGDRWKLEAVYEDTPIDYIKPTDTILDLETYVKSALLIP